MRGVGFLSLFLLALVVLAMLAAPARNASAQTAEELLRHTRPLLIVEIPSASAFIRNFEFSPVGKLWRDPAATQFLQPLRQKLRAAERLLVAVTGQSLNDLRNHASGAIGFALVSNEHNASKPGWLLFLQHDGDAPWLEQVRRGRPVSGMRVTRARLTGPAEVIRVQLSREEPAKIPAPKNMPGGEFALPAGVAARRKVQRELLLYSNARWLMVGEHVPDFVATAARLSRQETLQHFVPRDLSLESDLAVPVALAIHADLDAWWSGRSNTSRSGGFESVLGLQEFTRAVSVLGFGEDGSLHAAAALETKQPRSGLIPRLLLMGQERPAETARLAPPETVFHASARYAPLDVWNLVRQAIAAANPQLAQSIQSQLEQLQRQSGIAVESDLLARLGPGFAQFRTPGASRDPADVWLIQVRESDAFIAALERLLRHISASLGLFTVQRAALSAWPVLVVRPGRATATAVAPFCYICPMDDWLVVTTREDGLRAVAERIPGAAEIPTLAKRNDYALAMATLPPDRLWEAWLDPAALPQLVEDRLRPWPEVQSAAETAMTTVIAPPGAQLDAVLREHLGPLVLSRATTADRVLFQTILHAPTVNVE